MRGERRPESFCLLHNKWQVDRPGEDDGHLQVIDFPARKRGSLMKPAARIRAAG
ncbi:unnamed protein product [Ciceribacter selenitireducens ATCC BAA-1503]|uniref:Uncharacterized protein n=1 Tax=Ciceribacter selenitireducens ATCC BAA-1503 TaxID=1336235 RepID=A0A376AJF1_9HYPH|nr:unnamed protein product [Ciceribacter selenitireducens ATCC BAA-1503]